MNPNFKYVIIAIIGSLIIVFIGQLYWLSGLYNSIKDETTKEVIGCIEAADYNELSIRMDSMENKSPGEKKNSISISKGFSLDEDTHEDMVVTKRQDVLNGDTVTTEMQNKQKASLEVLSTLFDNLKMTVHFLIDSLAPANINRLDSLIIKEFEAKSIITQVYYTELVYLDNDSVVNTSKDSLKSYPDAESFIYKINNEHNIAYRTYTAPLTKTVLLRMSGILSTTLLIIIILGFAFWYLIRTVMRQKTLEEMKDDFTNNMTHELKTPIAVAYSATDALLTFKQDANLEKREQYLNICKDQLIKLSGLVEQILSMSMEQRVSFILKKENIDAKEMVESLIELYKLKSDKKILFKTDILPADITIYADRVHVYNMIGNLIENAIKYSYRNNPEISIKIRRDHDVIKISVIDNGIGITQDKQQYIFDKFYRVPTGNQHNVKGYGLGLFYVKTMAEKHGGKVEVTSQEGKGSAFCIKIPVGNE